MGEVVPATDENLRRAVRLLRKGELVCFPTETVYGVGADATDSAAVERIFRVKGRPAHHPLIVHLPADARLDEWADQVPSSARLLAERFWPGPLTLVLRRGERVPLAVTGGQDTVALRVPGHPVAGALLAEFGSGVAAPSANRFGRISPTTAGHAEEELGEEVALVLDGGPCEVGVESSIVDLTGGAPRLLRPGGVTRAQLEDTLGVSMERSPALGAAPRVPGDLPSHYAPSSPLVLIPEGELETALAALDAEATLISRSSPPDSFGGRWRRMPAGPEEFGRQLYAALREADRMGRPIVVELPPDEPAWEAVNDRLARAAGGRAATLEGRRR